MIHTIRGYRRINLVSNNCRNQITTRCFSSGDPKAGDKDIWTSERVSSYVGHTFPDFIEGWNRKVYRKVGYGLAASSTLAAGLTAMTSDTLLSTSSIPAALLTAGTVAYFHVGERDIKQKQHSVRRNYPVIGNLRYVFETIRPELRQYFVESDMDGRPFDRMHRVQIYQRAKNVDDTLPFGTRRNLYDVHAEWACHSMWPKAISIDKARHTIGTSEWGCNLPYSSSIFNVSGMSYGAISENAILSLNNGAKFGNFSHNTGEGGVSEFHRRNGGDLVWNIGTGYFGCGTGGERRVFDEACFQDSLAEAGGQIKMIEIKLSQGAKPGHGGLLPKSKITKEIANARKLSFPPESDCHSPSSHSAFSTPTELVEFLGRVRELSGGLPVGIKMCVGRPGEFAALGRAIVEVGYGPDFITVDGAEGGTGAAPPEFSDAIGLPLEEGLVLVRNILVGAGLRDKVKIIASGRITSGFGLVRNLALGADVANSARGFMMSLGCIQALKCNTNKCPTGVATTNKDLMDGLDPEDKAVRVYNYHKRTVQSALDIIGAMGHESVDMVSSDDIMRRVRTHEVRTLSEHFPEVESGCLLAGTAPERLQTIWDDLQPSRKWIY